MQMRSSMWSFAQHLVRKWVSEVQVTSKKWPGRMSPANWHRIMRQMRHLRSKSNPLIWRIRRRFDTSFELTHAKSPTEGTDQSNQLMATGQVCQGRIPVDEEITRSQTTELIGNTLLAHHYTMHIRPVWPLDYLDKFQGAERGILPVWKSFQYTWSLHLKGRKVSLQGHPRGNVTQFPNWILKASSYTGDVLEPYVGINSHGLKYINSDSIIHTRHRSSIECSVIAAEHLCGQNQWTIKNWENSDASVEALNKIPSCLLKAGMLLSQTWVMQSSWMSFRNLRNGFITKV